MATVNNTNQGSKNFPETKIVITINAQIDKAFNYIAPHKFDAHLSWQCHDSGNC